MSLLPSKFEIEVASETVYAAMSATPQYVWPLLSEAVGSTVWVKHENHTPIGAFKVRGGVVYMADLLARKPSTRGVIAATRGNHGQSIAYAARAKGISCTLVVPEGNSVEKNAAMRGLGADLVVHGRDFQAALEYCRSLARERRLESVPSFGLELVKGVATYGMELLQAAPEIETLYVPIGLGSGIVGCVAAREALGNHMEIVGVVSEGAPCYAESFSAGKVVSTASANTFADGVACRTPSDEAFEIIHQHVARVITVPEASIEEAIRLYYRTTHNLVEGAGAVALAGLLKEKTRIRGKCSGVVLTGGNIDRELYLKILGRD